MGKENLQNTYKILQEHMQMKEYTLFMKRQRNAGGPWGFTNIHVKRQRS